MDFRILGPLEVVQEGRPLPLGAAKQRALLAILVLHADQVVSVDRLIDLLWGEEPPETASNTLQVYVSGLRKVLEPARSRGAPGSLIVRRSPGYALLVEPDQLDSRCFERLVEQAMAQPEDHADARAAQLREALALWRGPALADFAYEAFAQAEISRLEEMRMDALEARIEADLALGRHATLLGELDSLAALHPLRETLRAHQMVALYRSGRQADALAVYAATRRVLDEELGIDPGTHLQRLEQQILLQDEALDPPVRRETAGIAASRRPATTPGAAPTRKLVTVLCCDLEPDEGLDPEARPTVVDRLQRLAITTLESHGALTEVTPDDHVVGVFGVPTVHEDDTVRAARAATEVLGLLPSLRSELPRGAERGPLGAFGIATGEVVTVGSELPRGGITKEAASLASAAVPGEVLLTEEARRNLGSAAATQELPRSRRGDRATRSGIFRLSGSVRPVSDSGRRLNAPMVGRGDELAGLTRAFERALSERSPHLFTLLGDAGVGKSRLLAEFVRRLADRAEVLSSRCPPYGEGLAFLPASDIVKQAARLGPELDAEEAGARIRSALGDQRDASVLETRLVELAGFGDIEGTVEELSWAVRKLLESQARRRPVVVVFDDVHWAEPSVLDLVEHVADWARSVPLLLVCSARPEFLEKRSSWGGGKLNATSMLLEPLSDGDCMTLLDNLFGAPGTPSAIRHRIVEAAEGNPLFVEEMARMLVDDGHLRREAGQWIVASDVSSVSVPPTIQALIAARLDRLEGVERTVLQHAAVVGKDFSRELIEHLGDPDMVALVSALRELVRKELVRPYYSDDLDEERYRFRHILIREAAYSQVPKRRRAELHERLADRLGSTSAPGEIVAFHLERAFLLRRELEEDDPRTSEMGSRAAELLEAAAHAAAGRGDLHGAASFLERALTLVEQGDRRRAGLLLDLSDVLAELGELRRAQDLLRALLRGREADDVMRARARIQLWEIRSSSENVAGWKEEATLDLQEATALFRREGDDLGLAKALNLEALIDEYDYRFGESAAALETALEHARRARDEREETKIFYAYVRASLFGPVHVDEALSRYAQFRARFPDNRLVEANCLRGMALLEAMKGRFEEARNLLGRYGELLVDLGLGLGASKSLTPGMVEMLMGDYRAAERTFRKSYDELGLAGERNTRAITAAYLARALYEQGRQDEALEMTKVSEELAPEDDFTTMIEWASVRAKVLARRGEGAEADFMTRRVVALAAETDELETRATTLLDRAEVLRLLGRAVEAKPCIEEALELYARKGDVTSGARARASLEAPLVIDLREQEAARR